MKQKQTALKISEAEFIAELDQMTTPTTHGGKRAGRPKLPNKKQTKTIRLYPADIIRLTKEHGSIQKWINKVVKQIYVGRE